MEGLNGHAKVDFQVSMADFDVVVHGFSAKEGRNGLPLAFDFLSCYAWVFLVKEWNGAADY